MVMFARRVAHMTTVEKVHGPRDDLAGRDDRADRDDDNDDDTEFTTRTYRVTGELFWASSNDLVYQFDYSGDPEHVVLDLTDADIWDASTVATLDAVQQKYAEKGKTLSVIGLDGASQERLDKLSGRLGGAF